MRRSTTVGVVTFLVAQAVFAGACWAATLVLYNGQNPDNSNQSGIPPWAPHTVGSGVTATSITRAAGINTSGVDNLPAFHASAPFYRSTTFAAVSNGMADDGPGSPQQAMALANDAYLAFTLSPSEPLKLLKLSKITYNISQGTSTAGQERGYAIYSSLDGFTSALVADAKIDALRPDWVDGDLSLGDALVPSVTFRLYLFVGDGAGIGSNIDFDNIQVVGEVVPEPSSLALVATLGCVILFVPFVGRGIHVVTRK